MKTYELPMAVTRIPLIENYLRAGPMTVEQLKAEIQYLTNSQIYNTLTAMRKMKLARIADWPAFKHMGRTVMTTSLRALWALGVGEDARRPGAAVPDDAQDTKERILPLRRSGAEHVVKRDELVEAFFGKAA